MKMNRKLLLLALLAVVLSTTACGVVDKIRERGNKQSSEESDSELIDSEGVLQNPADEPSGEEMTEAESANEDVAEIIETPEVVETEEPVEVPSVSMEYIQSISATSVLSEYNMSHSANRMIDGDLTTAWMEGVSGYGEGEKFELVFNDYYEVKAILINAGYQKSASLYEKNSRPAVVTLLFGDEGLQQYTLRDVNEQQEIILDKPVVTNSITLKIESVYPGTKYEDTAITEIYVY